MMLFWVQRYFSAVILDNTILKNQFQIHKCQYIRTGDHLPYSDSAVMLIIREEIQPYLAGQKSIDDVIDIIENRVATVKKERG